VIFRLWGSDQAKTTNIANKSFFFSSSKFYYIKFSIKFEEKKHKTFYDARVTKNGVQVNMENMCCVEDIHIYNVLCSSKKKFQVRNSSYLSIISIKIVILKWFCDFLGSEKDIETRKKILTNKETSTIWCQKTEHFLFVVKLFLFFISFNLELSNFVAKFVFHFLKRHKSCRRTIKKDLIGVNFFCGANFWALLWAVIRK
jgi:hypothetical protein